MAIAIDGSTPIRFTGTPADNADITSASFTAPSGAVLVCCVSADTGPSTDITILVSDTGGLTWTKRAEQDAGVAGFDGGHASVWSATTVSSVSRTIGVRRTSTGGGNSNRISAKCYVVTGQHASPFGAAGQSFSNTNNLTAPIFTSTAANSFAFVAACDWQQLGAPASSDLTIDTGDYAGFISVISGFKDCGTTGAETANLDAGGTASASWTWAALELLAATAAGNVPYNPWQQRAPLLAQ